MKLLLLIVVPDISLSCLIVSKKMSIVGIVDCFSARPAVGLEE